MNELSAAKHHRALRRQSSLLTAMAFALWVGNSGAAAAPLQSATSACLPGERGYFRASLRGALELKPDWRGAPLHCEGGARPDARGVRLGFSSTLPARLHSNSQLNLRVVFGVAAPPGALRVSNVPTNITIIVEGENRIYSTLGDDKCTVEALVQEPLPQRGVYRVAARGFCTAPAVSVGGSERLYIDRFDFAGRAQFEEQDLHAPNTTL
jgi:hypothetical protein